MADMAEVTTSDPVELLAAGRRHLAVRDYTTAVGTLAQACEELATRHGDQADQCAEPYLWYGKALLGLAREETALLGKIGNDKEGEDAEDDQDDEMEGNDANGSEEADPAQEESKDGEPAEESSDKPSTSEEAKEDAPEPAPAVVNGEADADESVAELDDEDVENIQLAWEMFELARTLLDKRVEGGDQTAKSLLADAYLGLGEVALESETYDKAVADMEKCLEIQKELYKPEDRRIAETHYQIGLANSLSSNFDASVAHFSSAASILEARIKQLEAESGAGATAKLAGGGEVVQSPTSEISELRELLPEIREKIEDMKEYKAETIKRLRETLLPSNGQSSSGIGSSSGGIRSSSSSASTTSTLVPRPAADISHLVKRKRAPSPAPEGSPAKKPAPDASPAKAPEA